MWKTTIALSVDFRFWLPNSWNIHVPDRWLSYPKPILFAERNPLELIYWMYSAEIQQFLLRKQVAYLLEAARFCQRFSSSRARHCVMAIAWRGHMQPFEVRAMQPAIIRGSFLRNIDWEDRILIRFIREQRNRKQQNFRNGHLFFIFCLICAKKCFRCQLSYYY